MKCAKWTIFLLAAAFFCAACNNKPNLQVPFANLSGAASVSELAEAPDSTIYGEAGDFGMSTFTLITDGGDTLYLSRTSAEGIDGQFYGSLKPGNRYAITVCDSGEAVSKVINLTQLEHFTKDYLVHNGHLILNPEGDKELVQIQQLNDTTFDYISRNGTGQHLFMPEDTTSVVHFD